MMDRTAADNQLRRTLQAFLHATEGEPHMDKLGPWLAQQGLTLHAFFHVLADSRGEPYRPSTCERLAAHLQDVVYQEYTRYHRSHG